MANSGSSVKKLSVVVALYNEAQNVEPLLSEIHDAMEASPWPCQQIREEVFLAGRAPGSPGTLPGVGTRLQRFFKGLIDGIGR